jgi:SAM-dependent methyltransferase
MAHKVSSRELGLILGARLLKTEDLHYGYWAPGLEVTLRNLPAAQTAHSDYLLSKIPPGVKTILDVGCGTGHVAQLLLQRGYDVECVSPAPLLTEAARKRLGPDVCIYPTTLEALQTSRTYDLLLFSESFQYIAPDASLARALELLTPGGHVLLCDFFALASDGDSPLSGGHSLAPFYVTLARHPFQLEFDDDITAQTAPNLQVIDDMLRDYFIPVWETLGYYFRTNKPWLVRLLRPFLRKRIEKLEFKYFSRSRTAEAFIRHKSYRCMLLSRTAVAGVDS